MQKGFIQLVLLIVLAVVLGGFAGYSGVFEPLVDFHDNITGLPTPDPTAEWKTYTSAQYGFEVKYPENYFYDFASSGETTLRIQDEKYRAGGYEWPRIEIIVGQKAAYQTVLAWTNAWIQTNRPNIAFTQSSKNIGGIEVIVMSTPLSGNELHHFVSLNERIAVISCIIEDTNCDQILSTFRFTDPTTGWKTYEHPEFSVKYPPEWTYRNVTDYFVTFYSINIPEPVEARANKVLITVRNYSDRVPAPDETGFLYIDGSPARQNTRTVQQSPIDNGGQITETFIFRGGKVYEIWLNSGHEFEIDSYNKLLASFKFKDSGTLPSWTKYPDPQNGFEIQYPGSIFYRTPNSEPNQVVALTGYTETDTIFYVSAFALPLRQTDGVPCSEAAGGYIRPYEIRGTINISGNAYPRCVIDRELQNDQALHVSFNYGGYTWVFRATAYDKEAEVINSVLSTFRFTK